MLIDFESELQYPSKVCYFFNSQYRALFLKK